MNKILSTLTIVLTIALGFMYYQVTHLKLGSAPQGVVAQLATSSTVSVGPSLPRLILFPANQYCASRVISTGANPIMLSFDTATSSANPGTNIGFYQGASTTVSYDSGIYGCSTVSAYGFTASTTITIAEFR